MTFLYITVVLDLYQASECITEQLSNKRGVCVPRIQELIRISRQFPHTFRSGDNDTTPIVKCSELKGKLASNRFRLKYVLIMSKRLLSFVGMEVF